MIEIVIAQGGFVWVGDVDDSNPYQTVITNARCIRRWGTENLGLEYLTTHGPTSSTVLDSIAPKIKLHPLAIIAREECDESKWRKHIDCK